MRLARKASSSLKDKKKADVVDWLVAPTGKKLQL